MNPNEKIARIVRRISPESQAAEMQPIDAAHERTMPSVATTEAVSVVHHEVCRHYGAMIRKPLDEDLRSEAFASVHKAVGHPQTVMVIARSHELGGLRELFRLHHGYYRTRRLDAYIQRVVHEELMAVFFDERVSIIEGLKVRYAALLTAETRSTPAEQYADDPAPFVVNLAAVEHSLVHQLHLL